MGKKSRFVFVIQIRDEQPESYFPELRNLNKYLNSFMRIQIRDPESF
jgi:hypothetical protein